MRQIPSLREIDETAPEPVRQEAGESTLELSRRSAQAIVEEVGAIVRQNINMMDRNGRVIASTDASRVGSVHDIARQMVENGTGELYVTEEQATPTVRTGLNLSVSHQGRIVGVIGITGPYEEVSGYGQVVKKMVEILIRENVQQDRQRMSRRVLSRFLEDWIMGSGLMQPQALGERGFRLGIDISLPRRVMVVSPKQLEKYASTAEGQKILEQAGQAAEEAAGAGSLMLSNSGRQIILLHRMNDRKMEAAARRICEAVREKTGLLMSAGIDGGAQDVHVAYSQANKAWRSARTSQRDILTYDQVTLELFTEDVSDTVKQEYVGKVFRKCSHEELCQWMGLLEEYFGQEGSLLHTAQALHIHKNTLTYKLRKLQELTGYDVRLPSQSPVLYMAMLFFRDVKELMEQ